MSGSEQFYPPAQYSGAWLLWMFLAIAVLVVVAWLLLAARRRRRARQTVRVPPPHAEPTVEPEMLRDEYIARIRAVEHAHMAHELDARAAHLELSRLVRAFVNEHSGLEAPVLTLEQLAGRDVHPSLIEALRTWFYPGAFEMDSSVAVRPAAKAAREVVLRWP